MVIGIIGYGVVGSALAHFIKTNHPDTVIKVYDPNLKYSTQSWTSFEDSMADCQAVFIAVPVPTLENRTQDLSILKQSLTRCPLGIPIFIKSTVLPGTCDQLSKEFNRNVYAMPEFLTERTAKEDVLKHAVVCGGSPFQSEEHWRIVKYLFSSVDIKWMSNMEAELAKYTHNCFAALKVNYFNNIKKLCEQLACSYSDVLNGVMVTGFVERTHTQVPGPDGKNGYGGKCLPKDLKAFLGLLNEEGMQLFRSSLYWTEFENGLHRGNAE